MRTSWYLQTSPAVQRLAVGVFLQAAAAHQEVPCAPSNKTTWARRATEPAGHGVPDMVELLDPPVYIKPGNKSCNIYLPDTNGLGRLLWTLQYFVANGLYVVVSTAGTGMSTMLVMCSSGSLSMTVVQGLQS